MTPESVLSLFELTVQPRYKEDGHYVTYTTERAFLSWLHDVRAVSLYETLHGIISQVFCCILEVLKSQSS